MTPVAKEQRANRRRDWLRKYFTMPTAVMIFWIGMLWLHHGYVWLFEYVGASPIEASAFSALTLVSQTVLAGKLK